MLVAPEAVGFDRAVFGAPDFARRSDAARKRRRERRVFTWTEHLAFAAIAEIRTYQPGTGLDAHRRRCIPEVGPVHVRRTAVFHNGCRPPEVRKLVEDHATRRDRGER